MSGEKLLKLAPCVTRISMEQGGIGIVKVPHKSVTWDIGFSPDLIYFPPCYDLTEDLFKLGCP